MRTGINLLLWTGHVTEEHRPLLEDLRQIGYELVEVPVMTGTVEHYAEVGRWLDDLGMGRTTSMAFTDPAADPSSANPACRAAAKAQMAWQIDCAQALGATKVIGPMFQTLGQRTGHGPTEAELAAAAEVLANAAERARVAGITLAIEALNRFECHLCNTLAAAQALADRVDHPALGIMVDTFHAHIEEKDSAAAILATGSMIRHVHLSENDRGTPGTGQVDFPAVLTALRQVGYEGDLVIEAFGRAVPELAAATCVWRDLAPSGHELALTAWNFCQSLSRQSRP